MNRTIEYLITEKEDGLRIEQFLRRKGYSGQNLAEIKRMPKSILINGVHYYMRQTLTAGDILKVIICETKCSEKIPPVEIPLDIIYEDEDCCNRLDRDTSGLTVVSKHLVSGSILSTMTKNREVHREYLAVVKGRVTPSSGTICAPLARKEGTIIERMVDFEHGEEAITHYKLIREANGHSLVSLKLETGRTHQIRVHMASLGHPLLGDLVYGPARCPYKLQGQTLHAGILGFIHPTTGAYMEFTAPLPEYFEHLLEILPGA